MLRKITSLHRDEHNDWVADLDCYHPQHVRHKPPFFNRPWVETVEGRAGMIGKELNCVRCDQLELPAGLQEYKRTPTFTETTIPAGLLRDHTTKAGVWGLIHVEAGTLLYTVQEPEQKTFTLQKGDLGVVSPCMKHHVQAQGAVQFFVAFLRRDDAAGTTAP